MADKNLKCPMCGGEMEEGFLVHGVIQMLFKWVFGERPKLVRWFSKKFTAYDTEYYGCKNCGYIALFAVGDEKIISI
jgi:hypothetical protein